MIWGSAVSCQRTVSCCVALIACCVTCFFNFPWFLYWIRSDAALTERSMSIMISTAEAEPAVSKDHCFFLVANLWRQDTSCDTSCDRKSVGQFDGGPVTTDTTPPSVTTHINIQMVTVCLVILVVTMWEGLSSSEAEVVLENVFVSHKVGNAMIQMFFSHDSLRSTSGNTLSRPEEKATLMLVEHTVCVGHLPNVLRALVCFPLWSVSASPKLQNRKTALSRPAAFVGWPSLEIRTDQFHQYSESTHWTSGTSFHSLSVPPCSQSGTPTHRSPGRSPVSALFYHQS